MLGLPYAHKVDVFSVGAIMIELFLKKEIFRSMNNFTQLKEILYELGSPSQPSEIGKLNSIGIYTQHCNGTPNIFNRLEGIPSEAASLILSMLKVSEKDRITAEEALNHPYFYPSKKSSPVGVPRQRYQSCD